MQRLRVAMAQINTVVGDFSGNTDKIVGAITAARSQGADVVAFPELAVCGYPPEDLLLKPQFIDDNLRALDEIAAASAGITAIVGFVDADHDVYNSAAIVHDGHVVGSYHKAFLPNYGVFDENRYFQAGREYPVYVIAGVGVGINICEDIWYEDGPVTVQAHSGAEVIVNINASPYYSGKGTFR